MRRTCGISSHGTAQVNGNNPSTHPQCRSLPPVTKIVPNLSSPVLSPTTPSHPIHSPRLHPPHEAGPSQERKYPRPSTSVRTTQLQVLPKSPTKQSSGPGKPTHLSPGTYFHTVSTWDTTPPHSRPSPLHGRQTQQSRLHQTFILQTHPANGMPWQSPGKNCHQMNPIQCCQS